MTFERVVVGDLQFGSSSWVTWKKMGKMFNDQLLCWISSIFSIIRSTFLDIPSSTFFSNFGVSSQPFLGLGGLEFV